MSLNRREFLGCGAASIAALSSIGSSTAAAQEGALLTKPIPKSGEHMPLIGLGTNQYGNGSSGEAREALLATVRKFNELGGKFIDTAPSYRGSEAVLGSIIAEAGIGDEILMATKCDERGGESTQEQMEESRSLLGFEQIDFMQVHNLRNWKNQLAVMNEWKQEGKIRYCGVTTSRSSQYYDLLDVIHGANIDCIQVNYSLADREAENDVLPIAWDQGLAVIVNLPFGRGQLFDAVRGVELPDWAAEFGATSWAQFFLKYIVSHPAVNVAIPGTTKEHYAIDNIGASMGLLPDASLRKRQEDFIDNL